MKKKVFKYDCPACGEKFDTPLTHKHSKMKICPNCGYLATSLEQ